MRADAHGAALGTVPIPASVSFAAVFMVANDDVLTVANSNLCRHRDRSQECGSYADT